MSEAQDSLYTRNLLVPKRGRTLRPYFDLHALNKHLRVYKFRMLMNSRLLQPVRLVHLRRLEGCILSWGHTVYPPPHNRKFLRFHFEAAAYDFLVLPFGLSLLLRIFTKVV